MNLNDYSVKTIKKQQGVALIVSLILLGIITVLALSSSYRVNAELKSVGGIKERNIAFQAAEAALAIVEQQLASAPPQLEMLLSTCTGEGCYNATCNQGLCFNGVYVTGASMLGCETQKPSLLTEPLPVWRDPALNVWNNAASHKTIEVSAVKAKVKYIVEFMCYVRKNSISVFDGTNADTEKNGVPLFRITAMAESDGGRAKVALQSTYKLLSI